MVGESKTRFASRLRSRRSLYLAAHQGSEAAAEFRKILDHRGIVSNEPIGVLAHLQLGRAYALQGDPPQSSRGLSGFPHVVERRRPGHSRPETSQGGIHEATVNLHNRAFSCCSKAEVLEGTQR